jgi:hypothetical protein
MKFLNKQARAVMDQLTDGLNGGHRKVDNGGKSIMAVHVEQINQTPLGPVFSVTHFYEQNGDLMHDPDMTFLRGITGDYFPLSFQQDNLSIYQEVVAEWTDDGRIKSYRPRLSADLTSFANTWMRNIKEQQNL